MESKTFIVHRKKQPGLGFRKALSFEPVIKTPFDLLKHLAVWQLQVSNKKSKGGPNGERKELSAHLSTPRLLAVLSYIIGAGTDAGSRQARQGSSAGYSGYRGTSTEPVM